MNLNTKIKTYISLHKTMLPLVDKLRTFEWSGILLIFESFDLNWV
jgi:hypothetical protein